MRKRIYDTLIALYPTHSVGQVSGTCTSPYLVVKFNNQEMSTSNKRAGWQNFEVLCYCPKKSILTIDTMVAAVKNALKGEFEFTGNITPDYLDEAKMAYMRSIKFRIPKEV